MSSYLVKGYTESSDNEKQTLYVGPSAKEAFLYAINYSLHLEIEIEIWEAGSRIITLKQEDLLSL
ncbi:hypothetical protein ABFV99_14035 [Cytobacillus horneckiae]|uniref:hypothetical protein n=1 Tax=Cytobacillus horneckiae TaxID=549687 RepID=UPI0034CEA26D